jgi:hypothetical protein
VIRKQKSALLLILLGILVALPGLPVLADDSDSSGYNEKYFEDRFDFLAILKITKLKNYLNYKGSSLSPVGNISVTYDYHPINGSDTEKQQRVIAKYEDLWYHDYTPIGCRRFTDMPVQPAGFGCIRLLPTEDAAEFPGALANAAIRLLLDINLHGCACNTIIVPKEILGDVFSAFSHFGFYEVQSRVETGIPGHIIVQIDSDPPGQQKRVYYQDQNF